MDLFSLTPLEVRALMNQTDDVDVLRALVALEQAASEGNEDMRIESVGDLADLVILERGVWE